MAESDLPLVGSTATVTYQHTDALGSPVATTNSSKTVLQRSEYEPYGYLLNRPTEDGPGYTGHVTDAATGLVYMQQRYYDPVIGRLLSKDEVTAYEQPLINFNAYVYALNNPYRFTDPDGRAACDWCHDVGVEVANKVWPLLRVAGEALGADVAYAHGLATGDKALQQTASEGMRENVKPQDGIEAATMLVGPRGGKGEGSAVGKSSLIDRVAFGKERQAFWKNEAKSSASE